MNNDLISREALKKQFGYTDEWYKGRTVCAIIDNAPTVFDCRNCKNNGNERECADCHDYSNYVHYDNRPQGKWENHGCSFYFCSNCGMGNNNAGGYKTRFCPYCGAKMGE